MQASQKKLTRFLEISCPRCAHTQIIYGNSSIKIKCEECNLLLVKTKGGKTKVKARVRSVLK